jgi:hypothetical protein
VEHLAVFSRVGLFAAAIQQLKSEKRKAKSGK